MCKIFTNTGGYIKKLPDYLMKQRYSPDIRYFPSLNRPILLLKAVL